MGINIIRFLAVLGGFLIVSTWITPAALAVPVPTFEINVSDGTNTRDDIFNLTCDPAGCVPSSNRVDGSYDANWSFTLNPDPSITSNYTLTNLSSAKQTFILTITLPIVPIGPSLSISGSIGAGSVIDMNGDGATLATAGSNPIYSALIDSVVPVRTLLDAIQVFTTPQSQSGGFTPATFGPASFADTLAQSATSFIQIKDEFTLTAHDTTTVQQFFDVQPAGTVPEPATLALLGVAFAGIGWARRRELN